MEGGFQFGYDENPPGSKLPTSIHSRDSTVFHPLNNEYGLIFVAPCLDPFRSSPLPNSSRSRSDHASGIGSPRFSSRVLQIRTPREASGKSSISIHCYNRAQDAETGICRYVSNDSSTLINAHSGGKETNYNGNLGTLFQPTCPIYSWSSNWFGGEYREPDAGTASFRSSYYFFSSCSQMSRNHEKPVEEGPRCPNSTAHGVVRSGREDGEKINP